MLGTLPTQLSTPVLKPKPILSFSETRSHSVAQAGLELWSKSDSDPECEVYRHELGELRCLTAPLHSEDIVRFGGDWVAELWL